MNKSLVILFVKEPKLGHVKTRLAKSCADDFTLVLYQFFVHDSINTLQCGKTDFKLCADKNLELIDKTFGKYDNFLQVKGDLGVKMQKAFEEMFDRGYEKVVLIGSDTPHITNSILDESFEQLNRHDAVLGPSEDGGYYLIGFNKDSFDKKSFENIAWSTPKVLEQTLQRLHAKSVYLTQELNDIDILDDLKSFYELHRKSYFKDSYTMAFLKESETQWKDLTLLSSVEDQLV